jgi:alkaline phosphatase
MKFAVLADLHFGPDGYWNDKKRTIHKTFRKDLRNFIKEVNSSVKLSFVIALGDLIAGENKIKDIRGINKTRRILSKLKSQVYHLVGNHDLKNISEKEFLKLINQQSSYYSFDKEDYHFIVLDTLSKKNKSLNIDQTQLAWLKRDLASTKKKTIIFTHYSLADQDLKGNPWFEGAPDFCLVKNRKEVRKILEDSKKVLAVINGHLHWNNKKIHKGIPYFTIQSLVENEGDKGIGTGAYAIVELKKNKISIDVKGRYPISFSKSI